MEWFLVPENWIALLTLTVLEIVLGIDNIVFIAILAGKLPEREQPRARQVGLALAMITRLLLLASIAWIVRLTAPLFSVRIKLQGNLGKLWIFDQDAGLGSSFFRAHPIQNLS